MIPASNTAPAATAPAMYLVRLRGSSSSSVAAPGFGVMGEGAMGEGLMVEGITVVPSPDDTGAVSPVIGGNMVVGASAGGVTWPDASARACSSASTGWSARYRRRSSRNWSAVS